MSLSLQGSLRDAVERGINVTELDPECEVRGLVLNEPLDRGKVDTILNLSFGMLGINSALVVKRPSRS